MMKRETLFVTLLVAILIGTSLPAFGDDVSLPPWQRGMEGTTFQQWTFDTDDDGTGENGPLPPNQDHYNPYGDPLLRVWPHHDYIAEADDQSGRTGIWPLSGEIDIFVPNYRELRPEKKIQIQITWKPGNLDPFMPEQPFVAVVSNPTFEYMDLVREDLVDFAGDGWTQSIFSISLWPNPYEEWIAIKGDIMVDQVVVDTYCVPEPATIALFAVGSLIAARKRSRS